MNAGAGQAEPPAYFWRSALHAGSRRRATSGSRRWNLEHLNDEHGEGCVERTDADFDAIARRIEALDADVVAFQEVENEAAALRVFNRSGGAS